MKQSLLATGLAVSSCLICLEARAASFTSLNVFGDSLADTGNLFALTDALFPPEFPALPPTPPYAQNNSNGPIWIDNLAAEFGLSPTLLSDILVNPATTPFPTDGINFAFSGALSSDVHILDDDLPPLAPFFPGFQEQIAAFTSLSTVLPSDPNGLYVVWIGANDYNEAFFNPASLPVPSPAQLPEFVTNNIIGGLTQLSSLGAKNFLVANLPAIGEAPFASFLDAVTQQDISSGLNQLVAVHNQLLSDKLTAFEQSQPDANITLLDADALFNDMLTNPAKFGFTNVTDSCLINFQPVFQFDGICDNPEEFLFWDNVHPTTAANVAISDFALAALDEEPTASVPEPGSLAALLAMGMMGSAVLRGKQQ